MDTLKSLADIHHTKILLLGSYDLFDLMTDYGQVARRGEILHYKRYQAADAKAKTKQSADSLEFAGVVRKLQSRWPSNIVPNFTAISDDLMEATLGCIGLLKGLMLSALQMQLAAKNEEWDVHYLERAAKSLKLVARIREETTAGEKKLEGASFGESYFSDSTFLAKIALKMD